MCWPVLLLATTFAAAQPARPLKIAVSGLQGFHVEPAALAAISDTLAASLQSAGMELTKDSDVADVLLTGSAGHFGRVWQLEAKVISAEDGALLASFSRDADSQRRLLDEIASAARASAAELLARAGRQPERVAVPRVNVVSVSWVALPVAALTPYRYVGVEYERVVLPWLGIAATPQYVSSPLINASLEVTLMARLYPGREAPGGFFVGPLVTVGIGRRLETELFGPSILAGGMVGCTFLVSHRVPVSFGFGAAYNSGGYNEMSTSELPARPRIFPLARANLGIAF